MHLPIFLHRYPPDGLKAVVQGLALVVYLSFAASSFGQQTTITSFTVGGTAISNSAVSATATVTINRAPSDQGEIDLDFGSWSPFTCEYGKNGGTCIIPPGISTTTAQLFWDGELGVGGAFQRYTVAEISNSSASAYVSVAPAQYSLSISPSSIVAGSTQDALVTVTRSPAAASPVGISFGGTDWQLITPVTLSGSSATTSTDNVLFTSSSVTYTMCVEVIGCMAQANLTLTPFQPTISLDSGTVQSEQTVSGTVSLDAAPRSNSSISISTYPGEWLSASVPISAGSNTARFSGPVGATGQPAATTVSADFGGGRGSTPLTILPAGEHQLPCPCDDQPAAAGQPINLTNGNVWIEEKDYSLPGLGRGLSLTRVWNSLWRLNNGSLPYAGTFGDGWRSTYEERLTVINSTSMQYFAANGDNWTFLWNPPANSYFVAAPQNEHATLTFDSTTLLFTLLLPDGTKKIFDNSGYLTGIVDRNGNTTTVSYDSSNRITNVTDAASQSLTFNYNDPSNINQATSIQDATGVIATYVYSSSMLTQATYPDGSQYNFSYNTSVGPALIVAVTDAVGKTLEAHTYDSYSTRRGLSSVRANGVDSVTVSYPSSNTTLLTDSFNNATTYTSAYAGPIRFVTSVSGTTCSSCGAQTTSFFGFDSNGNKTSSTDALNNTTSYTYDASGNVASKSIQLANGTTPTWNYTYNSFQEVLTATDPLNNAMTNVYDAKGNLLTTTTPSPDGVKPGSTTTFTYNTNGTLKTSKDPLGNITTLTYYPTGLINTIKDANFRITTYVYDARGNRLSIQDPLNGATKLTKFTYDSMNRLASITYPGATTAVQFHYDYRGRRDYVIDQNSNKTSYGYDDADRLISVTDAQSPTPGVTQYGYDTESNLTSITDASNRQTIFTYDPERRLTQTKFPSLLVEGYGYDADNNLTSKTDRNNQTIQYSYDALSNLLSKTYPDSSTVTYTYDLASRLTQVQDPTGTYAFTYDNMNRLTQAGADYSFDSAGNLTVGYGYDAASNRTSMTDPQNLPTAYTYDALNRLSTLAFNGQTPAFGFGYDALSRRTSLTRPNAVNTSYSYDPISRLLSVLHKLGTTTLDGATYTYDAAGNRKTRTDKRLNTTLTYGYDNIYQLLSAKQGATTKETYSYDIVGNRLSSLGVSPYSYNSSNELTALPSGSYTYDNNGNTKTKPDGTQDTWDTENRLTQVVMPGTGGTVNLKYDPFGRRIQKAFARNGTTTTTNYIYDGANVLETLDNNGNLLSRYTQGKSIDEPLAELISGTTSYYEQDGLGSVTSLSNSSGALANTYTYDSYGKLTSSTGSLANPFQYTGREFDAETGLYYYRARFYDQNLGRFVNEDPARLKGGINFYAYVGNSPTHSTDPEGTGVVDCAKALADLASATALVEWRTDEIIFWGGSPDPNHQKSLQQAVDRLEEALARVIKHCSCYAAAAAAIAAAEAALEAAAPYLLVAAAA